MDKTKRLLLNPTSYYLNPIKTIKSLLGHNTKIIKHQPQSIILQNDLIPVDVVYQDSNTNSNKIYYINPDKLKPLSINSNKYIYSDNNSDNNSDNIKFVITLNQIPTKTFPVRIFESLKSSVGYFANIIDNPLTSLITPLKNINSTKDVVNITNKEIFKEVNNEELKNNVVTYTTGLKLFNTLNMIDNIIPISSIPNNTNYSTNYSTTAYLINFFQLYNELIKQLQINNKINCIIFLYSDRTLPNICLYYPTINYSITKEELDSVREFVINECEEFEEFQKNL